jgi:hypothetical protein
MTLVVTANNSFTRPSNTTVYATGDLIANSETASAVVPITIDLGKVTYNLCFLRRARIMSSSTSLTNATYRLHLYTKIPVPINGDNGVFSTPKAGYIGALDVTLDETFSDGSFGVALPTVGSEINFVSEGDKVYGLLEARADRTPASAEQFNIILEAHRYE